MSLKIFKTPPPTAVLLPDTLFFVRALPVADAATPADVAAQVELALETLAPFPLAQMYYGHHWRPGAKNVLAYAAYRKRFSAANVDTWPAADAVLPAFVTLLTAESRPATTTLLHTASSITAIHWSDTSGVPAHVVSRALPQPAEDAPPLTDAELAAARAALRTELIRSTPGTIHLNEYEIPDPAAAPPPARADDALIFTTPGASAAMSGSTTHSPHAAVQTVAFTREQLDNLDVRDKAEITARRAARRRDLILWRSFLGCIALLVLCAILDIGVKVGRQFQKYRDEQVRIQAGPVAELDRAGALANRIEDLSTKRLLPLEMIDLLRPKLPPSILFTRVITKNLNAIEIQAKTTVSNDFNVFRNALASQPNIEKVEVANSNIRDGSTTFTLVITFRPGSVRAAVDEPPPKPPEPPKSAITDVAPAVENAAGAPAGALPSIQDQIDQQTASATAQPAEEAPPPVNIARPQPAPPPAPPAGQPQPAAEPATEEDE